jgi:hypothetical protein
MPADSFLSRWSKRKQESREAEPAPAQPGAEAAAARSTLVPLPAPAPVATDTEVQPQVISTDSPAAANAELPPVESLTPESDFRPFMKPDVDPAVRNQAMKSLFRDPHFNVMDMMDVYVDDYSKPDPIPESMLRQMTQSRMLNLFDDLPDEEPAPEKVEAAVEVAVTEVDTQVSQNGPDATNCPDNAVGIASEPQQEKED